MSPLSPTKGAVPSRLEGGPTRVLDGLNRVLFCHAHPDDETLSTGALISWLSGRGVVCDVLTATRGERGEVVPGRWTHLVGSPDLEARRRIELAGALRELGVADHAFLGTPPARMHGLAPIVYPDSGMAWITPGHAGPAPHAAPGCFSLVGIDGEVDDLLALVDAWRPDALVTYDAFGGYGHPDHVRMHDVAVVVGRATGLAVLEVVPPTSRDQFADAEWLDLASEFEAVRRALGHHETQLTVVGGDVVHVGGQRHPIGTLIGLRRTPA